MSFVIALWLRSGTNVRPFAVLDSLARTMPAWLEDQDESAQENRQALRGWVDAPRSVQSAAPSSSVPTPQGRLETYPTAEDGQVCGRPATKSRTDTHSQRFYKWVAEDGQTHISDERPVDRIASVVDLGATKQDFTYEIIPDGVSIPINFQGQLAAGSKRMYGTWHFFLGEENLRQSRIQVLLMGDPNRFDAYYAQGSPTNRKAAGFYRVANNQAVVKYDAKRPTLNLRTTFHEVSHLITASHLGPVSPWLTEGLAEYFETMEVTGQGGAIHPNDAHIRLLRKTPLPNLQHYLSITGEDWYGGQRERNYAIAWSLVNFLMSGSPGIYALQETIQLAHKNFCKQFSAAAALGKAYPGGFPQLEADWRHWMASGNFQVQQT